MPDCKKLHASKVRYGRQNKRWQSSLHRSWKSIQIYWAVNSLFLKFNLVSNYFMQQKNVSSFNPYSFYLLNCKLFSSLWYATYLVTIAKHIFTYLSFFIVRKHCNKTYPIGSKYKINLPHSPQR